MKLLSRRTGVKTADAVSFPAQGLNFYFTPNLLLRDTKTFQNI